MRKQNQVASDMALKINGLIKNFLKKLLQEFNATLRDQLIAEVREKLGLTDVVIATAVRPTKKKKRITKVARVLPQKKASSVNWETIKPARLTKQKRTKKSAPTAQVEPLVVLQAESPPILEEAPAEIQQDKPKLDRAARRQAIASVIPNYKSTHLDPEARAKLKRRIALIKGPKKKHIPFLILKKKEVQLEQITATPTLVVSSTLDKL